MKTMTFTLSEENYEDLLHILLCYELDAIKDGYMAMHDAARSIRLYLRDNCYEKEA